VVRHETGAFCWVGLATSDLTRAKAFYERVFGWQSSDLPAGEVGTHTVLRHTGKEVVLPRRTREARAALDAPHWTPYIAVEDADASALRARELGGTLLREPHDLLDAGRIVGVRDPTGGIVSLWQGRSRGSTELVGDPGALCWHELVAADVDQAKSFYGQLLGWKCEADGNGSATITISRVPIGTMREGGEREGVPVGSWIPYFGVERVDVARDRAEANGGRALSAPALSPIGRTVLLTDPQGAAFGLLEQAIATHTAAPASI
jgi:predicted enzyme related to lactoylglutathione lyase